MRSIYRLGLWMAYVIITNHEFRFGIFDLSIFDKQMSINYGIVTTCSQYNMKLILVSVSSVIVLIIEKAFKHRLHSIGSQAIF